MVASHPRMPSRLELMRALDEILPSHNVIRLRSTLCDNWTSFNLVDLEIDLEDGSVLRLLLKDLGLTNLHETARRIKPGFLYNPLREIKTYEEILAPNSFGTAHFYGAVIRPHEDRFWLFLEKMSGLRICAVNDFSAWLEAARWLARLHARFIGEGNELKRSAPLLQHDDAFYRLWLERALMFHSVEITRSVRESLKCTYVRAIERLIQLPSTLIHGEFFASNILVQETQAGWHIRPVDWEMAAIGPGLIDLAALSSGAWAESERMKMAAAYHDALGSEARSAFPLNDLLMALDDCRLYLAFKWLGWAPDWSPPPESAHDWLGEAIALAGKMRAR